MCSSGFIFADIRLKGGGFQTFIYPDTNVCYVFISPTSIQNHVIMLRDILRSLPRRSSNIDQPAMTIYESLRYRDHFECRPKS